MKSAFLALVLILFILQASADDNQHRLLRGGISDETPVAVEHGSKQDLGRTGPPDHVDTTLADDPLRDLGFKSWRMYTPPVTTVIPRGPHKKKKRKHAHTREKSNDGSTRDLMSAAAPLHNE
jgi:hypothetical protein